MGRRPDPAAIITRLAGSPGARDRLELMLQTLTGKAAIPEAAAQLGLKRSRFCLLRQEMLQAALEALEPRTRGRPAVGDTPEHQQIKALQKQVQALTIDLRAAQIREELALLMPHMLKRKKARTKKNDRRPGGRRRRAAARPSSRPPAPGDRRADAH